MSYLHTMTLEEAQKLIAEMDTNPTNPRCRCVLFGCHCKSLQGVRCCRGEFIQASRILHEATKLVRAIDYVANRDRIVAALKKANTTVSTCSVCGNPPPCSHIVIGKKSVTVDQEEWNNIQAELLMLRRYKEAMIMEEMRRQAMGRVTVLQPSTAFYDPAYWTNR